ncbi:MAG: tyrosine-type recombinase/integrase [Rhodospirillales bacterium]|nr:tyrosine-type recombinase/integrase [Rhodospirillales bacterium]
MRFTDTTVKGIKPKADRFEVWQDGKTGLGIRVAPSGRKSWVYMYRFDGKPRRMTLGTYPKIGLADANLAHAKAQADIELGIDPGQKHVERRHAERNAETVADLVEEYLERHARPHKRSADADERALRKEILPIWGTRKAASITRRDIINLLDRIVDRGSPVSANRIHALVSRMFAFAVERDILGASPCVSIKRPAKETPRDRVLSPAEITTFWHGLDCMTPKVRLALKLLFVTAQRREEVVCAPWSEFDLDEAVWSIPSTRTKNGTAHRVPLSELALKLLTDIRAANKDSQWLFPSPVGDRPMAPDAVSHALRNNLGEIKLENVTPHDLRRSAVSMMTSLGINRLVAEKVINHKDRGVAGIYDRFGYEGPKREALAAWGARLTEIVSGESAPSNVITIPVRQ